MGYTCSYIAQGLEIISIECLVHLVISSFAQQHYVIFLFTNLRNFALKIEGRSCAVLIGSIWGETGARITRICYLSYFLAYFTPPFVINFGFLLLPLATKL